MMENIELRQNIDVDKLLEEVKLKLPYVNINELRRAFEFSKSKFGGRKRKDGVEFEVHGLLVMDTLVKLHPDNSTLIAAILHELIICHDDFVIEDLLDEIKQEFGNIVWRILSLLHGLLKMGSTDDVSNIGNLRRMFLVMADDIRVVIIQLSVKLHDILTCEFLSVNRQKKIAQEILDLYVPVAARLGLYTLKCDLEDMTFRVLYPKNCNMINEQMKSYTKTRNVSLQALMAEIKGELASEGINVKVDGRIKNHYSIYKKLKKKNRTMITDLFDVYAIRIIVPSNEDLGDKDNSMLYKVLGIIHSKYKPIENRFKDYVASPKQNGYRSIHTTIYCFGEDSNPVEVQIRSNIMHQNAEYGVTSHWLYHENKGSRDMAPNVLELSDMDKKFVHSYLEDDGRGYKRADILSTKLDWVKQLGNIAGGNILNRKKLGFFADRIYVMTPMGDIKELTKDSTPIDFAFSVSKWLGLRVKAAKVNNRLVSLSYKLQNGDIVQILEGIDEKPRIAWCSFVKTDKADRAIKKWFKQVSSVSSYVLKGRDMLNKELKKRDLDILDSSLSILSNHVDGELSLVEKEEILKNIGTGEIELKDFVDRVFEDKNKFDESEHEDPSVLVGGEKNLLTKFPVCCSAKFPDIIVGYVTKGHYVAVHKVDCKTLANVNKDRLIDAVWENNEESIKIVPSHNVNVQLKITAYDRIGLIRDMSNILFDANANIIKFDLIKKESEFISRKLVVEINSYSLLPKLISMLKNIDGVETVELT